MFVKCLVILTLGVVGTLCLRRRITLLCCWLCSSLSVHLSASCWPLQAMPLHQQCSGIISSPPLSAQPRSLTLARPCSRVNVKATTCRGNTADKSFTSHINRTRSHNNDKGVPMQAENHSKGNRRVTQACRLVITQRC